MIKVDEQQNVVVHPEILSFVLSDYHKIGEAMAAVTEATEKYLERYITVATGAIGIVLALGQLTQSLSWQIAIPILAIPLIVGVASFSRLLALDLDLRRYDYRYGELIGLLASEYPELKKFRYGKVWREEVDLDYAQWSTVRAIIKRAALYGGPKTIIAIGNSLIIAAMCLLVTLGAFKAAIWPTGILSGVAALLAVSVVHVAYARMRYRFWTQFLDKKQSSEA